MVSRSVAVVAYSAVPLPVPRRSSGTSIIPLVPVRVSGERIAMPKEVQIVYTCLKRF